MARTSSDILIAASAERVMSVIADFAGYPDWATGVKTAEVLATDPAGRAAQVAFVLDATPIKDSYTLAYVWDGARSVTWTVAEPGAVLTSMEGAYELAPAEGGTRVTYHLRVEVAIPLLGMLKRKAEKVIVDTALRGLKRRVEALGG